MLKSFSKIFTLAFGRDPGAAKAFHPTRTCPDCGTKLWSEVGAEDWTCPNLDCPAQIRSRLQHWCSPAAMDIAGADAALIAELVSKGLARDPAELYRLKIKEIAALNGMSPSSAKALFDELTASQKRGAWRLLFGLSVAQLSAEDARTLCASFHSVDNVFAASADRLIRAGISEACARSVVHWHSDSINRKLVKRLFKAGLNFKA